MSSEASMDTASGAEDRSIVDVLIEERAPSLLGHPMTSRFTRALLFPMLRYRSARRFAEHIRSLPGHEVMDFVDEQLDLNLAIRGLENVPTTGRAVLVANHPTGIADGIAVWSAVKRIRPDLMFLANADALRVAPHLDSLVVPVDWMRARRSHVGSRETLQRTAKALQKGRLVVMFPSGRLARLTWRGVRDRPWLTTVVNLARRYRAPLVPLNIKARNSAMFYALSQISQELRDITLFNELLNKRGQRYRLTFGAPIDARTLEGDTAVATLAVREVVERRLRPRMLSEPILQMLRRVIQAPA